MPYHTAGVSKFPKAKVWLGPVPPIPRVTPPVARVRHLAHNGPPWGSIGRECVMAMKADDSRSAWDDYQREDRQKMETFRSGNYPLEIFDESILENLAVLEESAGVSPCEAIEFEALIGSNRKLGVNFVDWRESHLQGGLRCRAAAHPGGVPESTAPWGRCRSWTATPRRRRCASWRNPSGPWGIIKENGGRWIGSGA